MNRLRTRLRFRALLGAALLAPVPSVPGAQSPAARIEGRVLDAQGIPAPGVRVLLGEVCRAVLFCNDPEGAFTATPGLPDGERGRYAAEMTTDGEGRFAASGLAEGDYSILAVGGERGFAIVATRAGRSASEPLEVALQPASYLEVAVSGLAFDPSVHVLELVPLRTGANLRIFPRLSQEPRSWSFRSPPLPSLDGWRVGGTELVLERAYPATLFSVQVALAPGERRRLQLDLATGHEISGSVADAKGRPLSGASVVARGPGVSSAERGSVTGADGRYRIRGLADGEYRCELARWTVRQVPGCGRGAQDLSASRDVALPAAEAGPVDFRVDLLAPAPRVGEPAAGFRAPTLDGRTLDLADLRGKVVLLDFWATWCGMCRMELPLLVETHARLARDGRFEIVGVSLDDDLALVPRFVAGRSLAWPQTALGPSRENPVARLYGVDSTPATVLVDAQGRIAALNLSGEALRAKIVELLGER